MYYCSNQAEKLTALKTELALMKEAAELIPDIITEVQRFDGKQLNIKLSKAIDLLAPNLSAYVGKRWSTESKRCFEVYFSTRGITRNNQITLYWCSDVSAITVNGKFNATDVIAKLQTKYTELLKEVDETESKLQFISFYQQKIQQIENDLIIFEKGIPSKIKEYFNLGADVKYKNY
jgi:hypothetical protein